MVQPGSGQFWLSRIASERNFEIVAGIFDMSLGDLCSLTCHAGPPKVECICRVAKHNMRELGMKILAAQEYLEGLIVAVGPERI